MKKRLAISATLTFAVTLGCGGDDSQMTKREVCSRLASAGCARAVACEITPDQAGCEARVLDGCCVANDTCSDTKDREQAEAAIQPCLAAMSTWSCQELARGVAPEQCGD